MLVSRVLGLTSPGADRKGEKLARDLEKARTTIREQRRRLQEATRSAELLRGRLAVLGQAETPASSVTTRTPRTRITWFDLRGWLDGWREIDRRRSSAARYEQLHAHLGLLRPELVEKAGLDELEELERVLVDGHNVLPPRGQREGQATTVLRDAIDRARARIGRAERVLDVAADVLRSVPLDGLKPAYIVGFLARNRPALVVVIRTKQEAA